MHGGTDRDVAQRQARCRDGSRIPGPLWSTSPTLDVRGSEDVALLAVVVVQQRDAAVAVGVVLDGGDLGRDAVLVPAEVDRCGTLLVAATAVTGGLAPVGCCDHRSWTSGPAATSPGWSRGDLGEVRDWSGTGDRGWSACVCEWPW